MKPLVPLIDVLLALLRQGPLLPRMNEGEPLEGKALLNHNHISATSCSWGLLGSNRGWAWNRSEPFRTVPNLTVECPKVTQGGPDMTKTQTVKPSPS